MFLIQFYCKIYPYDMEGIIQLFYGIVNSISELWENKRKMPVSGKSGTGFGGSVAPYFLECYNFQGKTKPPTRSISRRFYPVASLRITCLNAIIFRVKQNLRQEVSRGGFIRWRRRALLA